MKSVIIIANEAIGSVLTVAQAIGSKVNCKVYIICSDKKTSSILQTSNFINEVLHIDAVNSKDYLEQIKTFYSIKGVIKKEMM